MGGPAPRGSNSLEDVRTSASTSLTSASSPWPASRCFQRFYFPPRCLLLGMIGAMQFPPPFSWLTLLWAIYLDPQCKIFLCTISSYYSRINQDPFHVKCQQRKERESSIAKPVQRFSPVLRLGDNRPFLLTTGLPGLLRATSDSHSNDAFPNLSVSRTVPEAGEDAGSCAISRTGLGSHTRVFQGVSQGVPQ